MMRITNEQKSELFEILDEIKLDRFLFIITDEGDTLIF